MQNQNIKNKYEHNACIEDSKVSRVYSEKSRKHGITAPSSEKHENIEKEHKNKGKKDTGKHSVQSSTARERRVNKPHNPEKNIHILFNRIWDFLKSDDALLIFVLLLLIQDGIDDEILLVLIVYLFISGK